jgi:hypothetical protein
VKTENTSVCVTVNCKVSDSAVLLVVPRTVNKVSINPIILSRTRQQSQLYM